IGNGKRSVRIVTAAVGLAVLSTGVVRLASPGDLPITPSGQIAGPAEVSGTAAVSPIHRLTDPADEDQPPWQPNAAATGLGTWPTGGTREPSPPAASDRAN